ncbi:hypothetical protein BM1_09803 [Bipolaris maydis]|nr:hypothetical protein BM1_09803 [Bipolaris maydis]
METTSDMVSPSAAAMSRYEALSRARSRKSRPDVVVAAQLVQCKETKSNQAGAEHTRRLPLVATSPAPFRFGRENCPSRRVPTRLDVNFDAPPDETKNHTA